MQLDRSEIRQPHQRRQIVGQNVLDGAAVSTAPDGSGLHPVRPVPRRVLLVEVFFVHSVGIALACERPPLQMRQYRRSDSDVVIDDLLLGESSGGIQDLFQIRQLELLALDLNGRIHRAGAPTGIVHQTYRNAKYWTPPTLYEQNLPALFDNFPVRHVISNFRPSCPSKRIAWPSKHARI